MPYYSKEDALAHLKKFCTLQDRCHSEVRYKLLKLKIYGDDLEDIIADLIRDDFLNEERFARSFVRGKFRMKSWGRNKIRSDLKMKKVSDYCIRKGLEEIDTDEYRSVLRNLLDKKRRTLANSQSYQNKQKMARYAMQKGYESDLVWELLSE